MKRYRFDSIIKGTFNMIGCILFIVPSIYFVLTLSIDKSFNFHALVLAGSGIIVIVIGFLTRILLRKTKYCVRFAEGSIFYSNKHFYNFSLKYVKFYISIIEPSLVIPKLYINDGAKSLVVYLTKKDVKKLIAENYEIKII
ncbi:hypothetical protein EI71_00798 [Anaeroplasma bactoclasticum]|jgi:hypothetical protein|uniref:Uncharacterized protein n=1 Tax=Anaeroplasma bactoclasticum TaxID=2088 RepID=A0A397RX43_9MOLU|nr:hypothetical protein [Anaeroplasma bactoclasticum]RIA77822.1 hypothetical protein EI71_00798 [Anaeroplasma bactoclasticum]